MHFTILSVATLLAASTVNAHVAAWSKGMYCLNGTSGKNDENTADAVSPLYGLPKSQWWFHAVNGCNKFPPVSGNFLDLPAGKSFTVELATNRATTNLSYSGRYAGVYTNGNTAPSAPAPGQCVNNVNLHAINEADAAGTAFAISYQSDIKKVTQANLVVFTVRYNTPWRRVVQYDVPANMPACPAAGCICAWGWVPNHCGSPNMYMAGYRCRVTGANTKVRKTVAVGKPPTWCQGNSTQCTTGAKQMVYFHQADGNNVNLTGYQSDWTLKSPGYNTKMGFADGAQNDIFN